MYSGYFERTIWQTESSKLSYELVNLHIHDKRKKKTLLKNAWLKETKLKMFCIK